MRGRKGAWRVAAAAALGAQLAAAAAAYEVVPVDDGGAVSGVVRVSAPQPTRAPRPVNKDVAVCGSAPRPANDLVVGVDGGVQWAVVSLRGVSAGKPFPAAAAVVDQRGCDYVPHVVLVAAGAELEIRNSDGILHNVRTASVRNAPLNRAQPKARRTMMQRFGEPERIELRCDVHPWMRGWVVVEDHPYVAVTDAQGRFAIGDVPPGTYDLHVWHETLGEEVRTVHVRSATDTPVTFALPPR